MTSQRIGFDETRLLVVGDLMLDRFCYGAVSRISPEAPVPVVHLNRVSQMLGGAGNVLANVRALDCRSALIGVVGDDHEGRICRDIVESLGADTSLIVTAPGRSTSLKIRYISGSHQLLRCDKEDTSPFDHEIEDQILSRFDAVVADFNAVAISDYAKGLLSDRVLAHVLTASRAQGIPVIVDPKRRDLTAYAGATVIKPNRSELGAFVHRDWSDVAVIREAAEVACRATGSAILLTMAEQGMALVRPGEPFHHFRATQSEVSDVSGAGDTALAVFCVALASGYAMEEAAMLANAGAGAVVRKLGTATLTRRELTEAVAALDSLPINVIVSLPEATRQVAAWKSEGMRVGFTNGCFDILHAGHVQLLKAARECCDRLVVGLNSDESVSRLKGPTRPVQAQASRSEVLAAIGSVDLVVVFDEDTPAELIAALQPTDLIKGADYTEKQVVGAKEVREAGGRVHLIDLVPNCSTTTVIERAAGRSGSESVVSTSVHPPALARMRGA